MLQHSTELQRCEAQLSVIADAFEAAMAPAASAMALRVFASQAVVDLLEHSLAQIAALLPTPLDPPLSERLWELAEIEDGLETALAFHGWRLDEPADELPPLLTERIDDQA